MADDGRVNQGQDKFKSGFEIEVRVWAAPTRYVFGFGVRAAHTDFELPSPEHRLDFSPTSGALRRGLFEHVAAQQIVRVPQPRLFVKNRGNPAGAVNRGSPSFGYFSWRSV